MNTRIGLIGSAGAGKDTFVLLWRQLAKEGLITTNKGYFPYINVMKFADPLYDICIHAYNKLTDKQPITEPHQLKAHNAKMLQSLGTALRESMGPEIFANRLRHRWNKNMLYLQCDEVHNFVTDVRYLEEYVALEELGFRFVRIFRQGTQEHLKGRDPSHESEQFLDTFEHHYTVVNDGSIRSFKQQILDIYHDLNSISSAA